MSQPAYTGYPPGTMVMTPGTTAPVSGPGAYPTQATQFYPTSVAPMPLQPGMPMQPGMMMMPPQPGVMMVPGGAMVSPLMVPGMMIPGGSGGALGPTGAPDFLSALGMLGGLYITQDVSLVEALTGCDTQNKYTAFAWNSKLGAEKAKDGKYGEALFRFKERSNCLVRQVCGPRREFKMAIASDSPRIATYQAGGEPLNFADALTLERPFKCTFLCLWRSILRVKHNKLGYLGEIYNPWALCDTVFHIRGLTPFDGMTAPVADMVKPEGTKLHYIVRGSLCQWGMFAPPLPFGPCQRVVFNIYKGEDTECVRPVGQICKVFSGCFKEMFTVADNYSIEFPADADPIRKALLTACVMLIDFLMFENQEKPRDNSSNVLNLLSG